MFKKAHLDNLRLILACMTMLPSTMHAQKEVYIVDFMNKESERIVFIAASVDTEDKAKALIKQLKTSGETTFYYNGQDPFTEAFADKKIYDQQSIDTLLKPMEQDTFPDDTVLADGEKAAFKAAFQNLEVHSLHTDGKPQVEAWDTYFPKKATEPLEDPKDKGMSTKIPIPKLVYVAIVVLLGIVVWNVAQYKPSKPVKPKAKR